MFDEAVEAAHGRTSLTPGVTEDVIHDILHIVGSSIIIIVGLVIGVGRRPCSRPGPPLGPRPLGECAAHRGDWPYVDDAGPR